ncbi:hypothetical protein FA15DRAFT_674230 [Coprinopsis marcescibilis]|uniref:Aminoglycoside phosphotransferase domain-containing protein n=1 Tax=Coprinopsis marcescibilis TaxID=230819 RepID=A0A5C3KUS7_COPMA|nr:hypothetical protein FA15DRAFT_674230 [Coprinopsis marcescibilis]
MPISDCWPPLEASLEQLDEPTHKRITSLHDHLLPHSTHISAYATSLHPKRSPCDLITSTYTWGQSFLVYEIVFREGESWVARFGLPPYEGDEFFNTPEQLERKILNEVGALRVVKERTAVPVPSIFGYCARHGDGFNQRFGGASDGEEPGQARKPHPLGEAFPAFILMSALRGKTIEDCGIPIHELGGHFESTPDASQHIDSPILRNYLSSLASIHTQLSQITFAQIGSFTLDEETDQVRIGPMAEFGLGPFDTAEEYYATIAEAFKRIAEAGADEEDEEGESGEVIFTFEGQVGEDESTVTLSNAQIKSLRRMFTAAIFPLALGPHVSASNDRGPFPLRHGDLHSENILVDEETGKIVGVIDWEGAGTVPWETAGGLNWEVQGESAVGDDVEHPEIHAAFNKALKEVESEMSSRFKYHLGLGRSKSKSRPASLTFSPHTQRIPIARPTPLTVLQSSPDVLSPSSSSTSLTSSSASSSSENVADFDSNKSHSRSSSSSKSNLTAFTSPPTSPASSIFDLNALATKSESLVKRAVGPPSILNTPPSPPSSKASHTQGEAVFTRAASEPTGPSGSSNCNPSQHTRSVSLSPVIAEAIREPLPADYLKQMVNKSELSLGMATMSIKEQQPSTPVLTWSSSVIRHAAPSTPRNRPNLHRRKQSSIALGSLPPLMIYGSPGASPAYSPAIPFNLYGPPPSAPPPLLAASLSLPPLGKRQGSPSPSPSPNTGRSRSPSPLVPGTSGSNSTPATPQPSPWHDKYHAHPHQPPHYSQQASGSPSAFNFPRSHNVHVRSPSYSHPHHAPSATYFLPPSLSRSVSASASGGRSTTGNSTATATPTLSPSTPTMRRSSSGEEEQWHDAVECLRGESEGETPQVATALVEEPLSLDGNPPVVSPSGSTLSELHAGVGSYVASYLAHWMFVYGCEYETVGKALWDVVLCSQRGGALKGEDSVSAEEAFWVWVKQTLGNGGDEEEEEQEEQGNLNEKPALESQVPPESAKGSVLPAQIEILN